jgi:hypothetical protein
MLRTFSDNPTCKHIVFGGCHDAGYLLNLDQYKHHAHKAARITLLESTPAFRGFMDLPNFQRTRFDNVFKNNPLPESYPQFSQAPVQSPVQAPATVAFQPLKRAMTNGSPAPAPISATPVSSSPSTTASSLAYPTPDSTAAEASWAIVGKTGVSPNENISIAPKINPKKKYAYYNKEGQRLDEALPSRDPAAAQSIDQRMKKTGRNLCNHWHLNKGKCHNKESCKFQHEPKLSPTETVALRYKTRSLACKDRYCENIDCCRWSLDLFGNDSALMKHRFGPSVRFRARPGILPVPRHLQSKPYSWYGQAKVLSLGRAGERHTVRIPAMLMFQELLVSAKQLIRYPLGTGSLNI